MNAVSAELNKFRLCTFCESVINSVLLEAYRVTETRVYCGITRYYSATRPVLLFLIFNCLTLTSLLRAKWK